MGIDNPNVILLVDDSFQNNELMQVVLEKEGYETMMASNGMEALEAIRQRHPDLIILDIMMPGMDGYALLDHLKRTEPVPHIPVIMLTARNNQKDLQKAMEMGAADYVIKPIDIEDILVRVNKVLKN